MISAVLQRSLMPLIKLKAKWQNLELPVNSLHIYIYDLALHNGTRVYFCPVYISFVCFSLLLVGCLPEIKGSKYNPGNFLDRVHYGKPSVQKSNKVLDILHRRG